MGSDLDFGLDTKENKLARLKKNIISWYPINENQTVLQVGQDDEILKELKNKTQKVTVINEKKWQDVSGQYDFVVLIGTFEKLETQKEILDLLKFAKNALVQNGKILLAMQNKFGMKYWAGQKPSKLVKEYESIISAQENMLSFPRISQMLENLGLKFKFYYPLPDYKFTNVIYTDEFLPDNDSIDARDLNLSEEKEIVSFSERQAYKQLIKENKNLFSFFSNSYFIEISNRDCFEDIKYVSFGITRKQEYSIKTMMKKDYVYKMANYNCANTHIEKIAGNITKLKDCDINSLDKFEENRIISSYLKEAKTLDIMLLEIYEEKGLDAVLEEIKQFEKNILKKLLKESVALSQTVFEKYHIKIPQKLKEKLHFTPNGIYDLIFQNCFVKNHEIFVYDQEWYEENIPIEFILYRALFYFTELKSRENIDEIFVKLELQEYIPFFEELEKNLQKNITDEEIWNLHADLVNNTGSMGDILEEYKKDYRLKINHIENLEKTIQMKEETIQTSNRQIKKMKQEIDAYDKENKNVRKNIEYLNQILQEKNDEIQTISNSLSWKITSPLRYIKWVLNFKNQLKLIDRFMPPGSKIRNSYEERRHQRFLKIVAQGFYEYTDKKTAMEWAKLVEKLNDKRKYLKPQNDYELWIKNNEPTVEELEAQRKHCFEIQPKISIVVPLYKTDTKFFRELLFFMNQQTYSNWELCLADGSPTPLTDIQKMCEKDERIKYKVLEQNRGIAENTNEAIKLATGDFIGLLDHDDLLTEDCLYEVVRCINKNPEVDFIYTDEDKIEEIEKFAFGPHFKPDFAPDTLRTNNYICHFSVFRKELMDKLGGERNQYDGAQDFDLILRMSEETKNIIHIPKVLYHWRISMTSTAGNADAKPYAYQSGIRAVSDHIERLGLKGTVELEVGSVFYKTKYKVNGNPKITILIPNKDGIDVLDVCLRAILEKTTYENYEVVIIENNSQHSETFEYYEKIKKLEKVKILRYEEKGFNYSKIINFGVRKTEGDFVVQLNNDTEILTPDWLENMIGFAQREDVGAVGARLYYPDDTIQHAGIMIGVLKVAAHVFRNLPKDAFGYFARDRIVQNMNAVTAACIMTKREIYEQVGFMNEGFAVAFNDVDFCLRIRELGKLIVYNPYIELIHYESKTRGDDNAPDKIERFQKEINLFLEIWKDKLAKGDEYYNKNFRLDSDQYEVRTDKIQY